MWTGTLAKAGKKRQVNLKVFDFSNNDMGFFCQGNLFVMLTLSPHLSLPSKIPMRAASSKGKQAAFDSRGTCSRQPCCSQRPLWVCASRPTLCKAQIQCKKAALHERECELIRRRCYFCWDEAMCMESHLLGRSNMPGRSLLSATGLVSLLDWFQTTASHWLPLHSTTNPHRL